MKNYFIQLYGEIDDLCNSRILEELNYYMFDAKNQNEMIFYFTKEQSIYLVVHKESNWNLEKLQVLCRTALRENSFLLLPMDNYAGYMSIWETLKEEPVKYFKDPKPYRIAAGRGSKLSKLLSNIKRKVSGK